MIIFSSGCKVTNFFCNFFILDYLFLFVVTDADEVAGNIEGAPMIVIGPFL